MLPGGLLYNFRFHQPDVLVAEEVCQTTATYFERLKSLDDQRPARVEQKLGITIQTVFVLGAYWISGSFFIYCDAFFERNMQRNANERPRCY